MDGCTELLVTHEDGHRWCPDPACEPDPVHHDWRVDCRDLEERCGECTETVPDRQRRAA
jgi:hypothetical protein